MTKREITWLRFAVYYDDELPIAIYKYREAAVGFVDRMKKEYGLDFRMEEEVWVKQDA